MQMLVLCPHWCGMRCASERLGCEGKVKGCTSTAIPVRKVFGMYLSAISCPSACDSAALASYCATVCTC